MMFHDCVVFPACAGMFRRHHMMVLAIPRFSPRARGCSGFDSACWCCADVFPACAGMFRHHATTGLAHQGFPRVRGDVPHQHLAAG